MTLGKTPLVTLLASAAGNGLIHLAFANSPVQITSMPMRSTLESLAARRRTSCSRWSLATVGSRLTSMLYCPFDALLQSAATFWMVPPGWVATNQLRVTGPPLPELPHPAAPATKQASAARPTGRSLSQKGPISPPPEGRKLAH